MNLNPTTLVFELVNFLVLLLLLRRVVYRPLQEGIAARKEALAQREREAQARVDEATALKADLESRARAIDELRQETLRDASLAAADERARILEAAREDAAADRARAQRLIEAEREASDAALGELAIVQATALAARLLSQLGREALQDVLLTNLEQEVARRAPVWRTEPDYRADDDVEVTWASLPHDQRLQTFRLAIVAALGDTVHLVHREDPSLDGGAVLRFGHRVLDASIAGQLEGLRDRARAIAAEEGRGRE